MKDENLRARAMEKFALINPPGSIKVLITQLAAARQRAATFESGDERTARVRAIVPKLDRLLHLARILEASASERSTLLRQLPLAAGVLAARPKPADSSSSRRQKKSDMPDGSGGSRSAKADLCEDDEGWSECATDQDIEDGLIQYYATQADIESAESDLDQTGEVLEEYCNTHPEDCYVPQPLPISLESEVVGEPATGESSDSVHEMPTSCAGNPYLECLAYALASALGIDEAMLKQGEFFEALSSAVRPSKRQLLKLGLRAAGWSLAAIWAVYETVDCIMNLSIMNLAYDKVPEPLVAYRDDNAMMRMSMAQAVLA